MKTNIEALLAEIDNKLESVKDDKNEKIVNYIEVSSEVKAAFIEYLISDYQKNNLNYRLNLRKYASIPLAVAAGSLGVLYAVQHGISLFDLISVMFGTYVSGYVTAKLVRQKNIDFFSDIVKKELDEGNIGNKLYDFYNNYTTK